MSSRIAVGTPEQFRWLEGIVKAVLLLNLFDAVFTLLWVWAGLAREANALLAELAHGYPVLFVTVKLGLVSLGSLLLWQKRRQPSAVIGIFVAFLAYYFVLLVHVEYASLLLRSLLHEGPPAE